MSIHRMYTCSPSGSMKTLCATGHASRVLLKISINGGTGRKHLPARTKKTSRRVAASISTNTAAARHVKCFCGVNTFKTIATALRFPFPFESSKQASNTCSHTHTHTRIHPCTRTLREMRGSICAPRIGIGLGKMRPPVRFDSMLLVRLL